MGARESDVGKSCVIEITFYRNLNLRLRSVYIHLGENRRSYSFTVTEL